MPDEVIVGPALCSGGARALPLFAFRHMSCSAMTLGDDTGLVASSFETQRFAMLLRMRSSKP